MYCSSCGENIKKEDNFCKFCGKKQNSVEHNNSNPEKQAKNSDKKYSKNLKNNDLLIGTGIAIIIFTPIVFLLVNAFTSEPVDQYRVYVSTKEDNNIKNRVEECEDCEEIILQYDNGTQQTIPLGSEDDPSSLKNYIIQSADSKKETIDFVQNTKTKTLDISLDISRSVVDRDLKQRKRGATKVYSDLVLKKINKRLHEDLVPGDKIIVRLYGPAHRDNPCRDTMEIRYTGPSWKVNFIQSERQKEVEMELQREHPPNLSTKEGIMVSNNIDLITNKIKEFYKTNLKKDNRYCHNDTALDQQFRKIMDDFSINERQNRYFILTNDGEFGYGDQFITPNSYTGLRNHTQQGKAFTLDGQRLCNQNDNTGGTEDIFVFIGMDYQNNLDYRQTMQDFFDVILKPCTIKYDNV